MKPACSRVLSSHSLSITVSSANTLFTVVNLDQPRHPADWPVTNPTYTPPNPEKSEPLPGKKDHLKPLTPPARGLLGLLLSRYGKAGEAEPETFADAYRLLHEHGEELFGPAK